MRKMKFVICILMVAAYFVYGKSENEIPRSSRILRLHRRNANFPHVEKTITAFIKPVTKNKHHIRSVAVANSIHMDTPNDAHQNQPLNSPTSGPYQYYPQSKSVFPNSNTYGSQPSRQYGLQPSQLLDIQSYQDPQKFIEQLTREVKVNNELKIDDDQPQQPPPQPYPHSNPSFSFPYGPSQISSQLTGSQPGVYVKSNQQLNNQTNQFDTQGDGLSNQQLNSQTNQFGSQQSVYGQSNQQLNSQTNQFGTQQVTQGVYGLSNQQLNSQKNQFGTQGDGQSNQQLNSQTNQFGSQQGVYGQSNLQLNSQKNQFGTQGDGQSNQQLNSQINQFGSQQGVYGQSNQQLNSQTNQFGTQSNQQIGQQQFVQQPGQQSSQQFVQQFFKQPGLQFFQKPGQQFGYQFIPQYGQPGKKYLINCPPFAQAFSKTDLAEISDDEKDTQRVQQLTGQVTAHNDIKIDGDQAPSEHYPLAPQPNPVSSFPYDPPQMSGQLTGPQPVMQSVLQIGAQQLDFHQPSIQPNQQFGKQEGIYGQSNQQLNSQTNQFGTQGVYGLSNQQLNSQNNQFGSQQGGHGQSNQQLNSQTNQFGTQTNQQIGQKQFGSPYILQFGTQCPSYLMQPYPYFGYHHGQHFVINKPGHIFRTQSDKN